MLLAVAKANNLDIEFVKTIPHEGVSDDYRLLNRLGKIPTFQGSDGYVLTEVIAIAIYRMSPNSFLSSDYTPFKDENILSFSYPCLKFPVENIHTLTYSSTIKRVGEANEVAVQG